MLRYNNKNINAIIANKDLKLNVVKVILNGDIIWTTEKDNEKSGIRFTGDPNTEYTVSNLNLTFTTDSEGVYFYETEQLPNNCRDLFMNSTVIGIEFINIDTSNVYRIGDYNKLSDNKGMFKYCKSLTSLNLSNFDTSNVIDMYGAFYLCQSLTELDLSNWDTSKVTDMRYMFFYCQSLTELDLSNWDTSKVTKMNCMFLYCQSLTELDLSNWDTSKVTEMYKIFSNCLNLSILLLDNFDLSNYKFTSYTGDFFYGCKNLSYIRCKQAFKDWCITNQDNISLPTAMREGGSGTWEILDYYDESTVAPVSLTISAINTAIPYYISKIELNITFTFNAYMPYYNEVREISETFTDISDDFGYNYDYNNDRTVEVSYTYYRLTATTEIIQLHRFDCSLSVDLQDQWVLSETVPNPNPELYEGVYMSDSSWHVNNGTSDMLIKISGFTEYTIYIRSYAESNYDYVIAYKLNEPVGGLYNSNTVQAHTREHLKSETDINSYTKVVYTNINPDVESIINIRYRKDGSGNSGDDRGYVLIPKIVDIDDLEPGFPPKGILFTGEPNTEYTGTHFSFTTDDEGKYFYICDESILQPYLFEGLGELNTLKGIEFNDFDTSNITDMAELFASNELQIEVLDISCFDISNVTEFTDMFKHCLVFSTLRCRQSTKDKILANYQTMSFERQLMHSILEVWEIVD